ncbi:unnamed protein product [Lampetra fluviatilis]
MLLMMVLLVLLMMMMLVLLVVMFPSRGSPGRAHAEPAVSSLATAIAADLTAHSSQGKEARGLARGGADTVAGLRYKSVAQEEPHGADGHKVLAVTSRRAGRDAWRSEEEEGAEALPGSAEGSGNTSAVRERNSRRLLAAATE